MNYMVTGYNCIICSLNVLLLYCLFIGDTVLSLEDKLGEDQQGTFMQLKVIRIYSAYIHKRRTMGPMGKGWLLRLWYVI